MQIRQNQQFCAQMLHAHRRLGLACWGPLDTEHIVVLPDIQIRGQPGVGGNDVEVAHGAVCADAPAAKILPKAVKMGQRLFDILSLDIGAFSLDGVDIALLHQ